jgi:voltage-gated potassium channel Kch
MKGSTPFRKRFNYWFDNTMSRGTIALIGWLFALSALLILAIAFLVWITRIDPGQRGFLDLVWASLLRTLDPGTMGGDQGGVLFLFSMLAITLGGIFVVSLLIGVLTSGIENKLEELRKGRSQIVEHGHTVILGWSPQVFSIISELVIANANQARSCIAILAPKDKLEMEDEIREKAGNLGRTRVVCRTGNPIDLSDLQIISPQTTRSIIILAPGEADSDTQTIKTILALTNNPDRRAEPYHIVAEIRDPKNIEVARMVGRNEAELILVDDLISRIIAQTCRQSGLSIVYTELLDFGGDEIYFKEEPGLVEKSYAEALLAYEDSALIGLRDTDGRVRLNPPMNTIIETGDQVIAISEDDDTIRLSTTFDLRINQEAIRKTNHHPENPEQTLILGWNRNGPRIVQELDQYVPQGSKVTIVTHCPVNEIQETITSTGVLRQEIEIRQGNPTDRRMLDTLQIPDYHHVITLGDIDHLDPQQADAHTLVTLLHLRDISEQYGDTFSIVSEMADMRNRALAEVTKADDFIVSDRLVSLMLSQISENKELASVFQDLFDPEGAELYLKPVEEYIEPGIAVNFYTVVNAAIQRNETVVGYRLSAEANDPAKAFGILINPAKSDMITFAFGDKIIVLAEH